MLIIIIYTPNHLRLPLIYHQTEDRLASNRTLPILDFLVLNKFSVIFVIHFTKGIEHILAIQILLLAIHHFHMLFGTFYCIIRHLPRESSLT